MSVGTLLTIWKALHYSPKKAEKLAYIQAELQAPEMKMQKPSDTRWLAHERAKRSLPALVSTLEEIYDAHRIATLLTKYKTVACIYMLSDVLHTLSNCKDVCRARRSNLASVPGMVDITTKRMKELKENVSSTWFKDHSLVFTHTAQLGPKHSVVTEEENICVSSEGISSLPAECHRPH